MLYVFRCLKVNIEPEDVQTSFLNIPLANFFRISLRNFKNPFKKFLKSIAAEYWEDKTIWNIFMKCEVSSAAL